MKNIKDKKVLESIDILSQQMAKCIIENNKDKLIAEIEEDILKSEKMKNIKDSNNNSGIIVFSSDSSEGKKLNISQKDNNSNNSIYSKVSNKTIKSMWSNKRKDNNDLKNSSNGLLVKNNVDNSSNKKLKKVSFAIDKKNKEEMHSLNISKDSIYKKEKENENQNENIDINNKDVKNNNNNNNNKKDDIEITLSPIYGYKNKEINYYNIKNYIDKNKIMQKKLYQNSNTNSNTNLTATFLDEKDKINNNNKDNENNNLILKSYTTNRRVGSLKNGLQKTNNFPRTHKRIKTLIEGKLKLILEQDTKKDRLSNSNEFVQYIDNISEGSSSNISSDKYTENKNNSKIYSISSISSDLNLNFSTNSFNKNSNLILDYGKNGRNFKYKNFLEKQLRRKRFTEIKINKMKREKELKELRNYYSAPKINSTSLEIVNNKGKYIPLFKRAVEIENEKKMKRLINQKIKNNNFIINNSNHSKRTTKQINDFFCAQMEWKDKIDKKNNKMKKQLKDKNREKNSEIINYEFKINPNSELIIMKKRKKNSLSTIDITQSNSEIITNSANRLYKDYEIKQKKLKKLQKELTPSFRPSINASPPIYLYKTGKKNIISIHQKIDEVKIDKNNDNSYNYKYQSNQTSYINNSLANFKTQKSRNPKVNTKNQVSSKFFNKKENNLKSTAVDSKNTKSVQKISLDANNTKLEKINENNASNEEKSNSNSCNDKNKNKEKNNDKNNINKSKNNGTVNDINNKSISIQIIENDEKNSNSQNDSKTINNNNNKNNYKTNNNNKSNNKISNSKQSKSKNNSNEANSDNSNTENNNKTNSPNNSKNSNEDKSTLNNIKIINNNNTINNKSTEKEKEKEKKETEKEEQNNIINATKNDMQLTPKISEKQTDSYMITNSLYNPTRNNSRSKIISTKGAKKSIKKSIFNIKINKNMLNKNQVKPMYNRHRSVITRKTSDLLLTKYNKKVSNKENNSRFENEKENDFIGINNFEKENYFNDFISKSSSNENSNNNIIKNSLYNLEDDLIKSKKDSFFDENFKTQNSQKTVELKKESKLIQKYKFNNWDNDENEENEEIEEETENKKNNENKSISWIKQLNEISKNEETEREKDELNRKKKNGASTTRSQTKRKNNDNEKEFNKKNENLDEDKLYMLNLRNSSSTGKLNPYTFTAKDELFYKFFLKKQ